MMKKVITRMLAFAAVLLCGGAWADYSWSGSMSATAAKVFDNLTLSELDSKLEAGWVLTGTLGGSSMTGTPYFTQVVPVTTTGETRVYQFQLNNYNHNSDRHMKYANIEFTENSGNIHAKQSAQGYRNNNGLEALGTVATQSSGNISIDGYQVKSLSLTEPVTHEVSADLTWDSSDNGKAVVLNVTSAATLTVSSAASPVLLTVKGSGDLTITGSAALTTPLIDASAHTGTLTLNVRNNNNNPVDMKTTVFYGTGSLVYNNDANNCGNNEYFLQIKSVVSSGQSGSFTKGGSGANTMMSLLRPSAITVAGGTLRRPDGNNENDPAWNIVNDGLVVTVKSGATFDIYGGYNKYIKYVLEEGSTLSKTKSGGGNTNTSIAGITLDGNATLNFTQPDYWVKYGYGNVVVALGDYTLTKSGAGELDLNNVQFTGNGTLEVAAGTIKLIRSADNGGSACSVAGTLYLNGGTIDLNSKTNFSTKNLKLASAKSIGNGTMTVNGEIDISALTSVDGETAILTGTTAANLTLGAATTYKFPDNNQKTFKLCNGTLNATAAPTSAQKAFIGTAEKVVTLAYDASEKTVSYTIVRDAETIYYYWHNPVAFKRADGTETPLIDGDEVIVDDIHHSNRWSCELPEALAGHKVYLNSSLNAKGVGIPAQTEVVVASGVEVFAGNIGKVANVSGNGTVYAGYNGCDSVTIYGGVEISCTYAIGTGKTVVIDGAVDLSEGTLINSNIIKFNENGQLKVREGSTVGTLQSTVDGKIAKKIETVDGKDVYGLVVAPVATIGDQDFAHLTDAITAANAVASEGNKVTITLAKDCAENAALGAYVTLDINGKNYSGAVTGSGTLIINKNVYNNSDDNTGLPAVLVTSLQDSAHWTGEVVLIGGYNHVNMNSMKTLCNANSTLTSKGNKGWLLQNSLENITLNLVDNGETAALNISRSSADWKYKMKLAGDGTLKVNSSDNTSSAIYVTDAANFSGNIDMTNLVLYFGNSGDTARSGLIKVNSDNTATIGEGKTWTAAGGITIAGTIKGSGTLASATTFSDGATIDLSEGTLTANGTVAFGASINLAGEVSEGDSIIKGLAQEPANLSFTSVTVAGSTVDGARLYFEGGAVKYTTQAVAAWTPNTDALLAGDILDWTAPNAWMNGSTSATWPTDQDAAEALNVSIDATTVKGVKIIGQVYVNEVVVSGALRDEESFQFHNHLMTVNNEHEVIPEGEGHDCLHTAGVNLTGLEGELGLKVPITGNIAFGSETDLVFATGTGDTSSTAYGYTFIDRGGSITVRGNGKFSVPTTMQALAFSIEETATAIYTGPGGTIGTLTGTGTIELQNGKTIALYPTSGQTLHYVSAGTTANTLKWTSGSTISGNDSKANPFAKIESGATLNIHGHDFAGYKGSVGDHSWFVNDGTLVFNDGDGSRFWRDHIVLGNGSSVKIDTGARHLLLYGGAGSADNCQIMLESGTATIKPGETNQGKTRQSLYFGNDGGGDYGTPGAGISVGNLATLTVSVPVDGRDTMTKWGAGALVLEDVADSYAGTITLKGGSLTAPAALADGKVTTDITGKVVKKVVNGDTTVTYSLVDATPETPITPEEGEIVIPVVPAAGIAIEPGAEVKVPTGTDASKIEVVYNGVELSKAEGQHPKYVEVSINRTTGAIELTTTDAAKPADTAIAMAAPTEEGADKVQFTISNPIPGLFYAVSSCDEPNGDFTSATGDQATSTADKTVSIPMAFTDGKKVKYYKVSVKATK